MVLRPVGQRFSAVVVLAIALTGCDALRTANPGPAVPRVVTIAITPAAPSIPLGTTQQLAAKATYSDSSVQDVTATAKWTSTNKAIVTVGDTADKGLLRGVSLGVTTVAASVGTIEGSITVTINAAALVSLAVSSALTSIAIGDSLAFVAVGTYTDASQAVVTNSATWASSSPSVAAMTMPPQPAGKVAALAAGSTSITATLGSIVASRPLTVLPIRAFEIGLDVSVFLTTAAPAIDAAGNVLAAWTYRIANTDAIYTARYSTGGSWTARSAINMGSVSDKVFLPTLVGNASGAAVLAWSGHAGIYAASFDPASGWQPVRTIASGSTPFLNFAGDLQLGVDANGNALLVWTNDNGDALLSSRYTRGSDSWTAPAPVANRNSARAPISLTLNPATGDAMLVWEKWTMGGPLGWKLYASRFVAATGWEAELLLYESDYAHSPHSAMNGGGSVIATWVDISGVSTTSLKAKRFTSAGSWGATMDVSLNDPDRPASPQVAINSAGNAVVAWRNASNKTVKASRYNGTSWTAADALYVPTGQFGDPVVLTPTLRDDGRGVALWVTAQVGAFGKVELSRLDGSWQTRERIDHVEHKGVLGDFRIAHNASGRAVAFWTEGTSRIENGITLSLRDIFVNIALQF